MSIDMPQRCCRCTPVGEERGIVLRGVVALAFVREVRVGLEVLERGVADDAARAESFDGFE